MASLYMEEKVVEFYKIYIFLMLSVSFLEFSTNGMGRDMKGRVTSVNLDTTMVIEFV